MFVESLNKMEEIVKSRTNLSWESNFDIIEDLGENANACLLYTSPSPRDRQKSRMPSSA